MKVNIYESIETAPSTLRPFNNRHLEGLDGTWGISERFPRDGFIIIVVAIIKASFTYREMRPS